MKTKTLLMASALVIAGSAALAAVSEGDIVGTTEADIRAALEANGYTVQTVTMDGDEIEVEALYNGVLTEIELSAADGSVLEIEDAHEEDEDGEDHDESDEDADEDEDEDQDDDDDDDDEDGA